MQKIRDMIKILANDGIHQLGKEKLEKAGFKVITEKVAQEDLKDGLKPYQILLVRSATKVREEVMRANPQLKLIGRGGVGLDNIDLDIAKECDIKVINTPAASSRSVAELAMGHMFNLSRFLHLANREMPVKGNSEFKALKKSYAKGMELQGKTLGIIGFGRIGKELAKIALGLGMEILPVDPLMESAEIELQFNLPETAFVNVNFKTISMEEMLPQADYVSIHIPSSNDFIIGVPELDIIKKGAIVINTSRGGLIDEEALIRALDSGRIAGAGLDVFEGEPSPDKNLLEHSKISLSPHIGASTGEAQEKIGLELADQIIDFYS